MGNEGEKDDELFAVSWARPSLLSSSSPSFPFTNIYSVVICTRHCTRHHKIWMWHCCLPSRRFKHVVSVVTHNRDLWGVRVLWDFRDEQLHHMWRYQGWFIGGSAPWANAERKNRVKKKGNNGGKLFLLEGRTCAMVGRHKAAGSSGKLSIVRHIWMWGSGRALDAKT